MCAKYETSVLYNYCETNLSAETEHLDHAHAQAHTHVHAERREGALIGGVIEDNLKIIYFFIKMYVVTSQKNRL